eukprot:jgi/Mesvir1/12086/Mv00362-RA.1
MQSYLVLYNVSKKHNVGSLARCATAFGVHQILVVGQHKINVFGSHGASNFVEYRHFGQLTECRAYLKERDVDIVGVEIMDNAKPVQSHPFTKSTAFVLGNEGTGLSPKQIEICDWFVYIPQHGPGTASLNVSVAASIVFHHFALWAQFPERAREGAKFVVGDSVAYKQAGAGVVLPGDPSKHWISSRCIGDAAASDDGAEGEGEWDGNASLSELLE